FLARFILQFGVGTGTLGRARPKELRALLESLPEFFQQRLHVRQSRIAHRKFGISGMRSHPAIVQAQRAGINSGMKETRVLFCHGWLRMPKHPSGQRAVVLAVGDDLSAVDKQVSNAGRVLMRLVERGPVAELVRVKKDDVSKAAGLQITTIFQSEDIGR